MKKLLEYVMYTLLFSMIAGFGFGGGVFAFLGWAKLFGRLLDGLYP
ncbi:UNVERIFIED_CONTAM: hypothetical protein RF648_21455 [Kocuria sp. CPCC 205274]